MIPFDEAAAIVASAARPLRKTMLPIDEAVGRVLAADLVAAIDAPRHNVSAMDGYAVREDDLAELPVRLRVVGEVFAGQAELPDLGTGEAVRIFTGGAVPKGADRVVVQEIARRDGEWAIFEQPPGPARHIRNQGSDFRSGQQLLAAGSELHPRALVAAAAADVDELEVWTAPRFIALSTGDELAEPGRARHRPAAIPESVSFGVAALGERWGGECIGRLSVPDDPERLEQAGSAALDKADLIVVTGGASVGERDFAKAMFGPAGLEVQFSKVAIKPGKPVWLGRASGKLVLGLPGNPTSAMVTARLFLAPLLAGLSGRDPSTAWRWRKAPLAVPLAACGDRETFVRARWVGDQVQPLSEQDSGAQKALAEAELLLRRAAHAAAAEAAETVEVLEF